MSQAHLQLAGLEHLARIYSDAEWLHLNLSASVHSGLPPPGFRLDRNPAEEGGGDTISLPYIAGTVSGDTTTLTNGDLYWTTFAQYAAGLTSEAETQLLAKILTAISVLPGAWNDPLTYPIVYQVGQGETPMKWLQVTHRGVLNGEQFQHKLDWGNPGSDPTTSEADALALAQVMATSFGTVFWGAATNSSQVHAAFAPDVVYTEVGVVECTQDDGGGDVVETYGTQWFMYPTIDQPKGTAGTPSLPYEVSCAVSTQTDHRGASGRGRFYLPPFSTAEMQPGGLFLAAQVGSIGAGFGAYIDDIKGRGSLVPIVVSRTHKILNEITSLNVGRVPDSQRRRRRSLPETRTAAWQSSE